MFVPKFIIIITIINDLDEQLVLSSTNGMSVICLLVFLLIVVGITLGIDRTTIQDYKAEIEILKVKIAKKMDAEAFAWQGIKKEK